MYKLKYNLLTWIILKCVKIRFNMTHPVGYIKGDAILLYHSGNIHYKHAIEIRRNLFSTTNNLVDNYIKQGENYCTDFIMLEYL